MFFYVAVKSFVVNKAKVVEMLAVNVVSLLSILWRAVKVSHWYSFPWLKLLGLSNEIQ
jgi:hypothetical protein